MLFLQHPDMEFILNRVNEPDGEEFITNEFNRIMRGSSRPKDPNRFPKVPSMEGRRLMASGQFGANNYERFPNKSLSMRLLEREIGCGSQRENQMNNNLIRQSLIPGTPADQILHFEDPVYSGQFSDDGRFFYSCSQDFKIRLYDTTNPYNWKLYKTVHYPWGQWTLTDASLSPDNKWIAYSSHSSLVSIAPTDPSDQGDPYSLDLSDGPGVRGYVGGRLYGFSSIFSVRFSGNGRELVAGTNGNSVIVYDIESRSVLHSICGHNEDVNAVCFADKYSPHIIYSGSDDCTVKVWDRRSMGDQREVAAFVGHIAGLTYIDSKGDGRYVLSNGKDQSMKLWDIRKAYSSTEWRGLQPFRRRHFDYRMGRYNEDNWDPHPDDNSVVTFRGHQVLQTLIRCHFSPPNSSDSRYVYSGSKDGKVHIWNLDATKAAEIDVKEATRGTRPRDGRTRHYFSDARGDWATCVRDASWHPHAPFIAASALNGFSMSHGTVSLHSYGVADDGDEDDGSPPVPLVLNESLEPTPWENKGVGGYKASDYQPNRDDDDDEDFEEDEEVSE
jgi:DDB1- and CUL4-associated factor 11